MAHPLKIYGNEPQYYMSGGINVYGSITPGVLYHMPEVSDAVQAEHSWKLYGYYTTVFQGSAVQELMLPNGVAIDRGTRIQSYFDTPQVRGGQIGQGGFDQGGGGLTPADPGNLIVSFFTPGANGQETVITGSYPVASTIGKYTYTLRSVTMGYSSSVPSGPWIYNLSAILQFSGDISIFWDSNSTTGDYFGMYVYSPEFSDWLQKGTIYHPDNWGAASAGDSMNYANSTWKVEMIRADNITSIFSKILTVGTGSYP